MEYKEFVIDAFQIEPGKWRARIRRSSGRRIRARGGIRGQKFITERDAASASDALIMAMAAIDAGIFSREAVKSAEKH